jgi:hypothetical protein
VQQENAHMIPNGTKVAFKFQPGFGAVDKYIEGTGIVTDYGFSMRTACENTYVISTDSGEIMHVLSYNVRKV